MVADNLDLSDLNALARTSRKMNDLLIMYMYRRVRHYSTKPRFPLFSAGFPLFFEAVRSANLTAVRRFIEVGASVDRGYDGQTALHVAAHYGHLATTQLLIDNGVDI